MKSVVKKKLKTSIKEKVNGRVWEKLWRYDQGLTEAHPLIAGVDEVGRGPLAGSVVAACVILDLKAAPIEGLNDSKKLDAAKRKRLFEQIKRKALGIGIGICDCKEIDALNIFRASLVAMNRAIGKCNLAFDLLLVDGNQTIPHCDFPQKAIIKGDGISASIAAASIVAKVTRDAELEEMDQLFPDYGFAQHKGYATKRHWSALEKFGPCSLHRKSFLNRLISPDGSRQTDLFSNIG